MCNQTIIPPEKLDETVFCGIPFGYTQLNQQHIDKLNGTSEKVLFSNFSNKIQISFDPVDLSGPAGNPSQSYFMLTADFNRFFNICEKESVPMDNQDKQVLVMFDEPISNLHSMGEVLGVRLEPNFWNLGEDVPAIFVLIEMADGKIEFCSIAIHKNSYFGKKLLPHIEKKFPRPVREINMTVDELIKFNQKCRAFEIQGYSALYGINQSLKSMGLKAKG